jgi:deferrochelatase/peroxidase EfeB
VTNLDRRRFLSRSALALGAVGAAGAGVIARDQRPHAAAIDEATAGAAGIHERVGFDGAVQAGTLQPPQAHAIFAALDAVAPDASVLAGALQGLSYRARVLVGGGATSALEPNAPALDCGVLGPVIAPDALTVTIGFGASLFDGRFDLAARRPAWLTAMPRFDVDGSGADASARLVA